MTQFESWLLSTVENVIRDVRREQAPSPDSPQWERFRRFWARVDRNGGPGSCWPFRGCVKKSGYGWLGYKKRNYFAHVFAYLTANNLERIPDGMQVNHSRECTMRRCCNPSHLYLGTQQQNVADMLALGREGFNFRDHPPQGEKNPKARLDSAQVQEIRKWAACGWSFTKIARHYNISRPHAGNIVHRRAWQHLEDERPMDGGWPPKMIEVVH